MKTVAAVLSAFVLAGTMTLFMVGMELMNTSIQLNSHPEISEHLMILANITLSVSSIMILLSAFILYIQTVES